ncbi:PorV/PorQ family protein [candidate division KSB1 bacterium]|nr:PorV/PorQ family protein [candidate division KSB1 bacterium]
MFKDKFAYFILFVVFVLTKLTFAGEYGADFLRIGVGARPLAMGGAFVAMSGDASSFYWNPAGLAHRYRLSLQLDHVPMFGGLAQYNSACATLAFDGKTSIGLGWIRLGIDEIPRYSALQGTRFDRLTNTKYRSTGEPIGYFADNEDAFLVSFGRTEYLDLILGGGFTEYVLPVEISFGVTGKYIQHNLDDRKGTGQGFDAGAIFRIVSLSEYFQEPESWIGIGVQARDLTRTTIAWNTNSKHKDQVKTGIQTGIAASKFFKTMKTRFTITLDKEFGFYDEFHVGGEVGFFKVLALRGGYYNEHFSAGAGLKFFGFSVDYAFINHDLENTHRVSGSFSF